MPTIKLDFSSCSYASEYADIICKTLDLQPLKHEVEISISREFDEELSRIGRRTKGAREACLLTAAERVTMWLSTADEYAVSLTWKDIASFTHTHRAACASSVLVGKANWDKILPAIVRYSEVAR